MTPEDVLSITESPKSDKTFRIGQIAAPIFGGPVSLRILGPSEQQVVTPEMASALTELLSAPSGLLQRIETVLSTDCDAMCRDTGFDIWNVKVEVGPDQEPLEAFRLAFGMTADGRIPAGQIAKWVSFIEVDIPNGAYVKFTPPWNQDYGVLMRLEDGAFSQFVLRYYHGDEDEFRLPMPA